MVRIQASLLTCLMFGLNAPSFALPEDSQAVLEMHAGSADINQETHRGIFIGNVELDQGTTHIRAVKAITESNAKNQLTKAIIRGDTEHQAHYSVLVALDKPLLHAYADTIYYYPGKHTIKLIGHAHVEQGNNSFSAPIICYDTLHQHVTSEQKDNERTLIIFHPDRPSKISHTSEKNTSPTLQASSPPVLENGSKEDVL
ncbi:MAG: lipopolysaccharide transport periplasmic protein LptA [Legionellaceae bacterium]|nr:lipopolysaccharide transport periplasmic protein LptA [Legionellaceae bacterium]